MALDEVEMVSRERAAELLAIDQALEKLAAMDARKGRIVELRFFGGLSLDETAEVMGISSPTGAARVARDADGASRFRRDDPTSS